MLLGSHFQRRVPVSARSLMCRSDEDVSYSRMRDALNATGRPIFYSLCNAGKGGTWNYGAVSLREVDREI